MKTSRFKKTLALLLAVVMCMSTFCMTASAAELDIPVDATESENMLAEEATAVSPRSIILSKSGYFRNNEETYDFTILLPGWYHWTASAGDCNFTFSMDGSTADGSHPNAMVFSGTSVTYNVYFSIGIHHVTVSSRPSNGSFSIIISSGKA